MPNINALPLKFVESFAKEIAGKFGRLQTLVGHPTTSGDYHEEILRTVLRNFLPRRFSVKKGFIYAGEDIHSRQLDILIVDENVPAAYIYQEGDFAIVTRHAATAAIEVKSTLDKKTFADALENIKRAKELMQWPSALTGLVFGFSGPTQPTTIGGWFKTPTLSAFKGHEQLAPEAILSFEASRLLVRCGDDAHIDPNGKYYDEFELDKANMENGEADGTAFKLSMLLAMLVNACIRKDTGGSNVFAGPDEAFNVAQAERGRCGSSRFVFGEGLVKQSNSKKRGRRA